jgi:hypothetical protein
LTIGVAEDIEDGDNVDVDVDLGRASSFMTYRASRETFSIRNGQLSNDDAGLYYINVVLTDQDGSTTTYIIIVEVIGVEEEVEELPLLIGPVSAGVEEDPEIYLTQGAAVEDVEFTDDGAAAVVTGLSNTGEMTITFTEDMTIPDGWETWGTVDDSTTNSTNTTEGTNSTSANTTSETAEEDLSGARRRLQAANNPLDLSMNPSPDTDPAELGFTWKVVSFEKDKMVVQLFFDNPKYISSKIDNDSIKIKFNEPSAFVTATGE